MSLKKTYVAIARLKENESNVFIFDPKKMDPHLSEEEQEERGKVLCPGCQSRKFVFAWIEREKGQAMFICAQCGQRYTFPDTFLISIQKITGLACKVFRGFIVSVITETPEHAEKMSEILKILGPREAAKVLYGLRDCPEIIRPLISYLDNSHNNFSKEISKIREEPSRVFFREDQKEKIKEILGPELWEKFRGTMAEEKN